MPKTVFTPEELRAYFRGEAKGPFFDESRAQRKRLAVHANGTYPKEIIECRRPHEDPEVKEYRQKIWKAKTKPTFSRVLNSLSKIRRSPDWEIPYPDEEFTRIPEGETLEDYCEVNFPYFASITNWTFSVLLREYLIDPNAVMVVRPLEVAEDPTVFVRPYPTIYSSEDVIEFRDNNFCIIRNPLGAVYYDQRGNSLRGDSYYVITTQQILRYDQQSERRGFTLTEEITHGFGFLPAYQLKAVLKQNIEDAFLYESRLDAMVEELDEAAREYSDLQASKVMNIYLERWEISTKECPDCHGVGTLPSIAEGGAQPLCETCKGSCYISTAGPYGKMVIGRSILDAAAGGSLPIPPAGYVEKNVEVVRVQEEGVDKHLYSALASVNMEYLATVPLAQSGIAKSVDRDETVNFVHSIAEDLIRIMDWLYYVVARWRYAVQYPSEADIRAMVPRIPVPEHFDLFSTKYAEEDIKNAKDNKLNPVIISSMEVSYASKKFTAEPEVRRRVSLILELDPFPNVSEEDKGTRLQNDAITELDYIISSNIHRFVQRALDEEAGFDAAEYKDQRAVLERYANEIIDGKSKAKQVQNRLLTPPFGQGPEDEEEEDEQDGEVDNGQEGEEEQQGNVNAA